MGEPKKVLSFGGLFFFGEILIFLVLELERSVYAHFVIGRRNSFLLLSAQLPTPAPLRGCPPEAPRTTG